jgi:hypothetical protein
MNSMKFLYAAYAATWTIHLLYIGGLVRRYRRLKQDLSELNKK